MNKILKLFGFTALVAVMVFSMAACDNGTTDQSGGGGSSTQESYKTYTAYDEAGNAFILVVTGNGTYVLSIQRENGTTLGSSTGTVASSNNTSYTLRSNSGSTFIVIVNVNIIVSINNPIPLDNGGTKSPEGVLSPTKPTGTTTKYTVAFDDNGATSGVAPDPQTVTAGSSIRIPSGGGLSKTGFTFGGWNTNAYGTGTNYNAGSSYTVTGNVTLYAKWDADLVQNVDVIGIYKTYELYSSLHGSTINYQTKTCTLTLNADSSYTMVVLNKAYSYQTVTSQWTSTTNGTYTVSGNYITLALTYFYNGYEYSSTSGIATIIDNNTLWIGSIGYFYRQ